MRPRPFASLALIPAGLFLTAFGACLLIAPHGPVYWDTFGYVRQAIDGDVGGLGLGRPVFVLTSHAIARGWLAAGGSAWHVEPLLRAWWTACAATTAPLTWALAQRIGLTPRAAIIAGAAVALSPAMAHSGGAVLTDGAAAALFVLMCLTGTKAVAAAPVSLRPPAAPARSASGSPDDSAWLWTLDSADVPGAPASPDTVRRRWAQGTPGPQVPGVPDGPRAPGVPGVPGALGLPGVPRAPGVPDVPHALGPLTAVRAFMTGALAGLAVGVREQSLMNLAVPAFLVLAMPAGRKVRTSAFMAFGFTVAFVIPMTYVLVTQPGYLDTLRTWASGMRHDRALKTFGWADAMTFAGWLLSLGPAVALAALWVIARPRAPLWRRGTPLFVIVAPALAQMAAVAIFLGIAYSPRFLLSPFPVAVALPGALVMDRWATRSPRRIAVVALALVLPLVLAAPIVRARSRPIEAILRDWPSRLASVPADSVIVSGQPCAAVPLIRAILAQDPSRTEPVPDWVAVCPGWGWPADLTTALETYRKAGRPIAVDLRRDSWIGAEQRAALADVRRYLAKTNTAGTWW